MRLKRQALIKKIKVEFNPNSFLLIKINGAEVDPSSHGNAQKTKKVTPDLNSFDKIRKEKTNYPFNNESSGRQWVFKRADRKID